MLVKKLLRILPILPVFLFKIISIKEYFKSFTNIYVESLKGIFFKYPLYFVTAKTKIKEHISNPNLAKAIPLNSSL